MLNLSFRQAGTGINEAHYIIHKATLTASIARVYG